jgi:hypothetical protein
MALGARFIGAWFEAVRKQALAHLLESLCPLDASLAGSAAELTQPTFQVPANGGERQGEGRDPLLQGSAKLCGADEIVSEQPGQPFFSRHVRRLGLQLYQVHLRFEVAQVQLDVPTQAIKSDQFLRRVVGGVGQSGEQTQKLRAKARASKPNDQ